MDFEALTSSDLEAFQKLEGRMRRLLPFYGRTKIDTDGLFGHSSMLTNSIFERSLDFNLRVDGVVHGVELLHIWGEAPLAIDGYNRSSIDNRKSYFIRMKDMDVWNVIGQKNRNLVRKGRKNGVVVRDITTEFELFDFYKIYFKLMVSKNVPPHGWDTFVEFYKDKNSICKISSLNDRVCGGILGYQDQGVAAYPFHASDNRFLRWAPNQQLIWALLEELVAKDVNILWLGYGSTGSGVERFKKSFSNVEIDNVRHTFTRISPNRFSRAKHIGYKFILKFCLPMLPLRLAIRVHEFALRFRIVVPRTNI